MANLSTLVISSPTFDGSRLVNINASNVSSGTLDSNRLPTSGVSAGTYGSSSQVPQIVIDAQGRITSSSNVSVAGVSAFNYHSGNANFQILTSAGGSLTATIGQHLGTSASVSFQDLTVTGNVLFTGNTTTINANNLIVEDNIIQIGKDNVTDVVDLGFLGHYNNGANVHTGLFRDATDSTWKFFQNYPIEPVANANIDTSNASFQYANVTGHNITSNGTFYGSLTGVAAVATVSNTSTLTADNTTNATNYLTFVNNATGNQALRTDIGLSFNPSTNTLTTTTFSGAFSGSGAALTSIPNSATTASASNGASTIVARTSAGGIGIGFFDETVTALTLSGGNTAIDWNLGAVWNITLTASSTIYFTNPPANNRARTAVFFIRNSGGGTKTLTVTGARYTDGVTPILSTGANAIDALSFTTIDGGLNYYGSFILAALS